MWNIFSLILDLMTLLLFYYFTSSITAKHIDTTAIIFILYLDDGCILC
ncbi:hypothetical protein GFV14_00024 [Candidatus Hartigia pinicola]|nr:hypothetical protein GFV14_00024 [Candidatus Hartigia pinicola]